MILQYCYYTRKANIFYYFNHILAKLFILFNMIPNAEKAKKLTPNEFKELLSRTKKPHAWVARRLGTTPQTIRNIANGRNECSYVMQFALESLVYACEQMD